MTARPAESGSAGRGFGPCGDAWYERTCGGLLRVNCSRSEIWSEFRRLHSIEHTSSKSLCVDSVKTARRVVDPTEVGHVGVDDTRVFQPWADVPRARR